MCVSDSACLPAPLAQTGCAARRDARQKSWKFEVGLQRLIAHWLCAFWTMHAGRLRVMLPAMMVIKGHLIAGAA